MENTSLQELLKTFSKSEWKGFGLFLQSPYFNRSEKFQRFYTGLNKYYPAFEVQDEARKGLYLEALQAKSFSEAGYRNLCSDFLDLTQRFLSVETHQNNGSFADIDLIKQLLHKGLFSLAEKNMRKIEAKLNTSTFHFADRLRLQSSLNDLKMTMAIEQNRHKYHGPIEIMATGTPEATHTYLLLSKVYNYLSNYIQASDELKRPYDISRIEAYLNLYQIIGKDAPPELTLQHNKFLLSYTKQEEHYWRSKQLFLELLPQMHPRDAENALIQLVSFVNNQIVHDTKWQQEAFELYDIKLRNKFYENMRYLSYTSLYMAFINAMQLSKKGYSILLLEEFIPAIAPIVQKPLHNLCLAWIDFFDGKTDAAHEKLVLVETENLLIKYELRLLQCMIYYRYQTFDVLQNALDSFRQFNMYNKSSVKAPLIDQYSSFIRIMQLLMKLTPYPGDKKFGSIVEEIQQEPFVYFKKWFLDTAATLNKSKT